MKRALLIICISFTTSSLFAQAGFGLKAGVNYSHLQFSKKSYSTSAVLGFHVGAFYNHPLTTKAALQGEVQFSTEGNKWTSGSGNTTGVIDETQIRIPLLLQYNVAENIYIEAGPQYSLLLSIKQTIEDEEKEDISEAYKTGTFGYALGAGYIFKGNLTGLRAGLRYNGDFSKINSDDVGGSDLKNSLIQLTFMYSLSKN